MKYEQLGRWKEEVLHLSIQCQSHMHSSDINTSFHRFLIFLLIWKNDYLQVTRMVLMMREAETVLEYVLKCSIFLTPHGLSLILEDLSHSIFLFFCSASFVRSLSRLFIAFTWANISVVASIDEIGIPFSTTERSSAMLESFATIYCLFFIRDTWLVTVILRI